MGVHIYTVTLGTCSCDTASLVETKIDQAKKNYVHVYNLYTWK